MYNSYYYIPEELAKMFNEITISRSPYHSTYKNWWNRAVDAIRQDGFATETKRTLSGMAETKILTDDLKQHVTSKVENFRQKKEVLVKKIKDKSEDKSQYQELLDIWQEPSSNEEAIDESLELLKQFKPKNNNEAFTSEELLFHKVKGLQKDMDQTKRLYAKYLGLAGCRSFYWEYDQLCYFDKAITDTSLVSWSDIQNKSIKELVSLGHREGHAARIRYRYHMEEEGLSMQDAYDKVKEELNRLRPEVTYGLPSSVRSFYKTAKKHVAGLR